MNHKVSVKINNKWVNFGKVEVNKFGNLSLSIRNTQDFKDFVNNGGQWLNFALFEDSGDKTTKKPEKAPVAPLFDDSETIPF